MAGHDWSPGVLVHDNAVGSLGHGHLDKRQECAKCGLRSVVFGVGSARRRVKEELYDGFFRIEPWKVTPRRRRHALDHESIRDAEDCDQITVDAVHAL